MLPLTVSAAFLIGLTHTASFLLLACFKLLKVILIISVPSLATCAILPLSVLLFLHLSFEFAPLVLAIRTSFSRSFAGSTITDLVLVLRSPTLKFLCLLLLQVLLKRLLTPLHPPGTSSSQNALGLLILLVLAPSTIPMSVALLTLSRCFLCL